MDECEVEQENQVGAGGERWLGEVDEGGNTGRNT